MLYGEVGLEYGQRVSLGTCRKFPERKDGLYLDVQTQWQWGPCLDIPAGPIEVCIAREVNYSYFFFLISSLSIQ
jgi:hypothetical protein